LFVTPFDENVPGGLGNHILRVDFANLASVLRRASLLIHHGGIGTATQALRAATPQIILPFYYDQADNGDRVRRLGAGTMIEGPVPDAEALAEAMERCAALPRRPLESLRQRVRSGRGAQACFEALDELLVPPPPACASAKAQEAWQ
jgi:UDP:flavonoid glycosyltransferase YjiC (YdhE family)